MNQDDLNQIRAIIKEELNPIDKRLGGIDQRLRLDGIDKRLDGIDRRLDGIDSALNALREGQHAIREVMVRDGAAQHRINQDVERRVSELEGRRAS